MNKIIHPTGSGEGARLALRLAVIAGHRCSEREVGHRTEVVLPILRQQRHGDGEASFGIQLHGVGRQRTGLSAPNAVAARQGIGQGKFLQGCAVVGFHLPGHGHGVAQGVGGLHRVERQFKRRAFVLLHANQSGSTVARLDDKIAVQATGRQDKFGSKGAKVVGAHFLLGEFLAVDIQQGECIGLAFQHTGGFLVLLVGNAFDVDRLSGTVERAVGQQRQVLLRGGITPAIIRISDALRVQVGILAFGNGVGADFPVSRQRGASVCTGSHLGDQLARLRHAVGGIEAESHARHGMSRLGVEREHFQLFARQRERQRHQAGDGHLVAVGSVHRLAVGHHLHHIDAQFFGHREAEDGIGSRIRPIFRGNAGQRIRLQVEMTGNYLAGVLTEIVTVPDAAFRTVVAVLQVRPVEVQREAAQVAVGHVQRQGIAGIAHRQRADGQLGAQDAFPEVAHFVDALVLRIASDGLLADGQCPGRLLLTAASIQVFRLGQIDLRTDGTVAVAGYQCVQSGEIGRVPPVIGRDARMPEFQLIQCGQHQAVFPVRTLLVSRYQGGINALYPLLHQRIGLEALHRLVGFYGAAGQQVVEVVPVEAAAGLQFDERHIRLGGRSEQRGRIAQRLRAAIIHAADELGGRPQADVRGEVVAFHHGTAAQGAVIARGEPGIFLGQQGVEDGAVDGIRLRLRPLLQLRQAGIEAVRRQFFLPGRAADVGFQQLRGVALLQAFLVDLASQLDDGLRQALLLRLRHLFPQLVIGLGVQGDTGSAHTRQQDAAQFSDKLHKPHHVMVFNIHR